MIRRPHHLHQQTRVQRLTRRDIGIETVGVHLCGGAGDIAAHIIGGRDRHEQLHVGSQTLLTGLADSDDLLQRRRAPFPARDMRPRHRQIDRRARRQSLRSGQERLGLVLVIGRLGLTKEPTDASEQFVLRWLSRHRAPG